MGSTATACAAVLEILSAANEGGQRRGRLDQRRTVCLAPGGDALCHSRRSLGPFAFAVSGAAELGRAPLRQEAATKANPSNTTCTA